MSSFDQHEQQIAGNQINVVITPPPPVLSPQPSPNPFRKVWRFLWGCKQALVGVVLLCAIALYPLSPFIVNLIAEEVFFSPFVLLTLALLGISCFAIIPFLFGVAYGPRTGFFVGFVGGVLSGFLAHLLAAHDFPTKVQASFDLASSQSSWIWLLLWYSLLIGASAWFALRNPVRSPYARSGVLLLSAIGIYLMSVSVFSRLAMSFTALYPLLAISDQAQVLGSAPALFAALLAPAGLLLLTLLLGTRYRASRSNGRRTARWWIVAVVFIAFALPPGYEIGKMHTASTTLQNQDLPLNVPLNCASCDYPRYPFFQASLKSIENQDEHSQWDIALINPGQSSCIAVAFQSATLTNALFQVYQPIHPLATIHIDPGGIQIVSLFYQIVPTSTQHLQFALSLYLTPCTGTGNAGDEVQGSRELLFQ